jgi:hypothetical protein
VFALLLLMGGSALTVAPVHAQRAIVQPLPPPEMADLRRALARLAVSPKDVGALIDAGNASLALEDIDAAIAFFGRAEALDPGNARVKLGLAGAYVVSTRPIEALRLFAEAEKGGADASLFAAKRGLAFDLVGDNASAQQQYRLALSRRDDPRVREQLAISQAVSGDRKGFEATLLPLLEAKDLGAFRTRAFGLAILKRDKEAADLAKAVMPAALANAFMPYLRQLPQLSPVEQIAAVHLGVFPAKGQPTRSTPAVAARPPAATSSSASGRLTPSGPTLGSSIPPANSGTRGASSSAGTPPSKPAAAVTPAARPVVQATQAVVQPAQASARAVLVPATPQVAAQQSAPDVTPATQRRIDLAKAFAGLTPATQAALAPGAVDVTRLTVPRDPKPLAKAPPKPEPKPEPKPALASAAKPSAPGPKAKAAAKPAAAAVKPAKPAKPAHPARIWLQLAAGSNRDALAFDWRRLSKAGGATLKGKEAHVAQVGRTNRLLAGPYASIKEANAAVKALRDAGVESLRYDSPDGQEVVKLK